ncbi:hypothetical protein [Paenibacillus tengchongensis]|uniref:hypothetical protein n=1 Tax=Paenibacillus tengchongensis TaxID=2608684 RepID=UPI00124F5A8F|nr:hypothetical protein [Paenibacillus tengchongensis]
MKPEFSAIGLMISILILLPSMVFFTLFPPKGGLGAEPSVHAVFIYLERIGQMAILLVLIFFTKQHFSGRPFNVWAVLMAACLLLYYIIWVRYIAGGQHAADLTRPFLFIPIPLAVFPVCALLCAAAWGHSLPLALVAAAFAVGHLTVSWASAAGG